MSDKRASNGLTLQYLTWAMLSALRVANPNAKSATIKFDLQQMSAITAVAAEKKIGKKDK